METFSRGILYNYDVRQISVKGVLTRRTSTKATRLAETHLLCDDHHTPEFVYAGALRLGYFYRTQNYPAAYILGTDGQTSHLGRMLRSGVIYVVHSRMCPIVNHRKTNSQDCDDRHTDGDFLLSL